MTIGELTERLNQAAGYEDVRRQTVRDDIAFDKRFQEPQVKAKLKKERDVEGIKARRDQLYKILNELLKGEKLTIGELVERLKVAGYEDVTDQTVRNDIAQDERFKEPQVKAKLDIKELESVDRETMKAQSNQVAGYEDLTVKTVKNDIDHDERFGEPQAKEKLGIKERERVGREAVKAWRDQELAILNELTKGGI